MENDLDLFEALSPVDDKFKNLINDCVHTLQTNGFALPIKTKPALKFKLSDSTSSLGSAYYPSKKHNGNYLITLSRYLSDLSDEQIKATIYHELGHILAYMEEFKNGYIYVDMNGDTKFSGVDRADKIANKKSLYHHGSGWQAIMKRISNITGQSYSRLANAEETAAFNKATEKKYQNKPQKEKPIYKFICPECGSKLKYTKKTRFVQTYNKKNQWGEPCWWCATCIKRNGKKVAFIKDEGSA